jgi:nucleoside-diphosphate-sugar epimerase
MKCISVLGTGWLGKPLVASLVEDGYAVKSSTTTESKLSDIEALEAEAFLVNIEEYEEFDLFLQSDILIINITSKDIAAYERLIQQIQDSPIEKVVFISSTSVYPNTNAVVTEDNQTLQKPLTDIEDLFRKNPSFETTIIRFAGLFGPNRHPGNWFRGGRKIPQPDGFVNMIHQEDCINIIHEIIDQNVWGDTFNACSNHHPTRREFYTNAKLSLGFDVPEFEETDKPLFKIISSKKLQEVLGYEFVWDHLLDI